jgi:hypothetical protein
LRPAVQIGYPGEKPKLCFPAGSTGIVIGPEGHGAHSVTMDACPLAVYVVRPSDIEPIEAKVILDKETKAFSPETYRRLGFDGAKSRA